jgi:hypothetical protein
MGELFPIAVDPSLGQSELITVEGALLPPYVMSPLGFANDDSRIRELSHV